MTLQKQKTHTAPTALPSFPSMSACSAATSIPLALLRQAKRAGCAAFDQAGRVHLAPLLQFLFRAEKPESLTADWHARFKRAQALTMEAALERDRGELVSRVWVAERMQRAGGDLHGYRMKSEAEHATRFASAAGDVAACRQSLRGIWDDILNLHQSLARHFSNPPTTTTDEKEKETLPR